MKIFLCHLVLMVSSFSVFSQTIYIANNNPGAVPGQNVFTGNAAIGDAIAAASDGDFIYVVPSGTIYNASNITKSLTIFGAGFNPDQTNAVTSRSQNMTVSANNVRISGMVVGPILAISTGAVGTMVDKCRVNRFTFGVIGSTIIQNCVMGENTSGQYTIASDPSSTSIRISNNMIYGTSSAGYLNNLMGATIESNVFVGISGSPGNDAFNIVQSCNIKNNIFYGVQARGSNSANYLNNSHQFNLTFGATNNTFVNGVNGNTASNNIEGSDPQFVNLPLATGSVSYNTSNDAQLQVTSPAKGSGEGGIDMGAFGGANPFDLFGTSLPVVQTVIAPATVTQGTNTDVRVKGKGN